MAVASDRIFGMFCLSLAWGCGGASSDGSENAAGGGTASGGSLSGGTTSGGSAGNGGGTVGGGGTAGSTAGTGPVVTGGTGATSDAIFTPASDALAIRWSSFFGGGRRWEKTRDAMTAEELALAGAIRVIPSTDDCWADAAEVVVGVTQGSLSLVYSANEFNGNCGRDVTLVTFEPVASILEEAGCLSSMIFGDPSLETAPSITSGDGCYHGLYNSNGATPEWWLWVVLQRGEHRIALDECRDRALDLTLYDIDQTTVLETASSEAGACPVLNFTLAGAGTFPLHVVMRSGDSAGDFYLRADRVF